MIAAFAVLLMLASAVIIMIPNDSEAASDFSGNAVPGSPAKIEEAKLWVLGNANGDMYIDASDKDIINAAITKSATVAQAPLCDANNDGTINADDVTFVDGLINGSATKAYYMDVDKKICEFKKYEKINMITLHRCVVRSATILANFDSNVKIVGMDSGPFPEVEFNVSVNYPGCVNVGVLKEISAENV